MTRFTALATSDAAIVDFYNTGRANGLSNFWVALSSAHPLVRENKAGQIRKVKTFVASALDELGNRVVLGTDGFIRQL
jgi:hypothetical protein